jgi:hypothetical protein
VEDTRLEDCVESHLRQYFVGHRCSITAWGVGPTAKRWPHFRVLHFEPGPRTSRHVYVSVGAAAVRSRPRLEFVLLSRDADATHIETLAMVAYYHHTEGLDCGHTFPIGRPWCAGASCEAFLVSLPYPFGSELEHAGSDDIRVLWLLPIHESERELCRERGLEALESRFDTVGIDYVDTRRPSVA